MNRYSFTVYSSRSKASAVTRVPAILNPWLAEMKQMGVGTKLIHNGHRVSLPRVAQTIPPTPPPLSFLMLEKSTGAPSSTQPRV